MRIGVDARTLTLPEFRGMASYLYHILEHWPEPDDSFLLFTELPPKPDRVKCPAKIEWEQLHPQRGSRFHVCDWLSLPLATKKQHLDVFWSPANIAIPYSQVPQIVTIHDTILQELIDFQYKFDKLYYKIILPFFTRKFTKSVITVSEFSGIRIFEKFRCDKNNIHVIHNGPEKTSSSFTTKDDSKQLLKLNNLPTENFIFALGAESHWKNTENLLKSFVITYYKNPKLSYIVCGIQKKSLSQFFSIIQKSGIPDHKIQLLGYIDNDLKDALYLSCDCFVYPSLFEGFGLPPLEAMQKGAPVIASNSASIPEVVGDAALLVDARNVHSISDAIISLTGNTSLQEELKNRGYNNVQRFSWEKSAKAHSDLFTKIAM